MRLFILLASASLFAISCSAMGPVSSQVGPNTTGTSGALSAQPDNINEYPVPTASALPDSINQGYFVESGANKIGFFNSSTGNIQEFPIPSPTGEPIALAIDSRGSIWFTDTAGFIGEFSGGTFTFYQTPTQNADPIGISSDGASTTTWFTEHNANQIGEIINGDQVSITEIPIPGPNSGPSGIWAISNGFWFTQTITNQVALYSGGTFTEHNIPTANSNPTAIVVDRIPGNVWFNEAADPKVGIINFYTGALSEIPLPHANDLVQGMTWVNDGNAWALTSPGNRLAEITPFGQVVEHKIPTPASGSSSDWALGRNLYFTERAADKIAHFRVHDTTVVTVRLTGESPYNDPTYGYVLGYSIRSFTSQVITAAAGTAIAFVNPDTTLTHTASFLGDASKSGAPWPPSFNGSSTISPWYTPIGTPGFSTGPLTPGSGSRLYETGMPGFYMIGCAFHYDSNEMRTVVIVR